MLLLHLHRPITEHFFPDNRHFPSFTLFCLGRVLMARINTRWTDGTSICLLIRMMNLWRFDDWHWAASIEAIFYHRIVEDELIIVVINTYLWVLLFQMIRLLTLHRLMLRIVKKVHCRVCELICLRLTQFMIMDLLRHELAFLLHVFQATLVNYLAWILLMTFVGSVV